MTIGDFVGGHESIEERIVVVADAGIDAPVTEPRLAGVRGIASGKETCAAGQTATGRLKDLLLSHESLQAGAMQEVRLSFLELSSIDDDGSPPRRARTELRRCGR